MGKPFFKYEYKGFGGCECTCDLEIHNNLVICTSRDDNEGTSITNMAEKLATDICHQFEISPSQLIWIEIYREKLISSISKRYSLVFFNVKGGGHFDSKENNFEFSNPRWVSIEKEIIDVLLLSHQSKELSKHERKTDALNHIIAIALKSGLQVKASEVGNYENKIIEEVKRKRYHMV